MAEEEKEKKEEKEKEPDNEERIKTPADMLLEYLKTFGQARSEAAAKDLGLPVEQIEEWADVLEEHGLVDIDYSPIKGMIIKSKVRGLKKEHIKIKAEKAVKTKESPKRRLSKLFERLRKRPRIAKLKKKKVEASAEQIAEKYEQAAAKLETLKGMKEALELKKQKEELRRKVEQLSRETEEIAKAPPEEVKKVRFFDFIKRAEKKTKEVKKETDVFSLQIESLESAMKRHKKTH
jgi:predicted ArsR family transcriptional regulator